MTGISRLAEFVAQADVTALPAAERAVQQSHVLDALVAAAAAARTPEGRSLAQLFGTRARPERVGQRAATIRLSEIDDIHLPSCTTPSAAAVATALSLATQAGELDPVRLASAIWAGTETMTRMGEAVRGPEILYRGVWPSCSKKKRRSTSGPATVAKYSMLLPMSPWWTMERITFLVYAERSDASGR